MIGKRFIELLSVDSTNNYAMQQLQKGTAMHGDVYFAFEQTAGKGQFNKRWHSATGENIMMSVVLNTSIFPINQQFILSMITALSTLQLFNKYTTENIKIKWPNDIYCRDRKAAGILIENLIRGKTWQFAVVGIGVNINQTVFAGPLNNPVSLKQITGAEYNVIALAKELCVFFENNLQLLYQGQTTVVLSNYNERLYKRNMPATFRQSGTMFTGTVKGVTDSGNLLVLDGVEKSFISGEIEWVLQ